MNKKTIKNKLILICFLIIIAVYAASACTPESTAITQDDKIIETIINNEKSLVSLQLRELDIEEYKVNAEKFLHPYFQKSYIEAMDFRYSKGALFALSVNVPITYEVSKVYTDSEEKSKTVFIISPVDDSTSRFYKRYILKKENDEWKLFQLREHYVVMEGPQKDAYKRIIDLFTNYDNKSIEYSSVTIRE